MAPAKRAPAEKPCNSLLSRHGATVHLVHCHWPGISSMLRINGDARGSYELWRSVAWAVILVSSRGGSSTRSCKVPYCMYSPTKIAVELSLAGHGRINWNLQVQVLVRRCRRCYQIESTVGLAGPWDGTVTLAVLYCSSMQASPGYCLVCSVAFYAIITVAPGYNDKQCL